MLSRLAALAARRPWGVIVVSTLVAIAAGAVGSLLIRGLSAGGFDDPSSESVRAEEAVERASGGSPIPSVIAVVRPGGDVASPAAIARVGEVARRLEADPDVARVVTALTGGGPGLVSRDRRSTYVIASFRPLDEDASQRAAGRIEDALAGEPGVLVGGPWVAGEQVTRVISEDLLRAELLAFPVILLLSLWVFRGLVAALLPPLVGLVTVFGGFLGLGLGNELFPVSVYALNLVTGLGLGLAIDYSLLVVSRYREEIARSGPGPAALARTMATAGRSVVFSAVTVAGALAGLMLFPQRFLFSMGFGGVVVALTAGLTSITLLPAVLFVLGRRVNALAPRSWQRQSDTADRPLSSGGWYRLSRLVMRRPGTVAAVSGGALILLGLPALGVSFTTVDASVLPTSTSARQVADALRADFPQDRSVPVLAVVRAGDGAGAPALVQEYAQRLGRLPGAAAVAPPRPVGEGLWQVDVLAGARGLDPVSQDLVAAIRAEPAPGPVLVGGFTARFVDQRASLAESLPRAIAAVVGVTLIALFLMTGSVVLPVKAVIMNLLVLAATLGILVLVFQDGRLEGLLGYTSQGGVDLTQPILLGAIAFGLSTDYAVFLLSRIKEARDAGATDQEAVAIGLQRTGRIVTAAALLFCVAVGAFATSRVVIIKQLGIGTAIAVALDATVVRALLVPSLMALLGRWNWWAPGPLRRLHARLGMREG